MRHGRAAALGSAVARPQTTAFGDDAYPDIWTKAAALLQSVVNNASLGDGNKRLGWLTTAAFLEINDVEISRASTDDVDNLVIDVAAGDPAVRRACCRAWLSGVGGMGPDDGEGND